MEIMKDRFSITELSERLQITDHALRYYEKEFCIIIPKDDRGRRYYTPELANLMYQIKNMRDEGLEIKSIKKVLIENNVIPALVSIDASMPAVQQVSSVPVLDLSEIRSFIDEIKTQLSLNVSSEVSAAKEQITDQITKELTKTKLELGACVENNMRKLETKMEKHFVDVDNSISLWRERSSKGIIKRLFYAVFK